jgi:methionine-rich copper-binding protein CopC
MRKISLALFVGILGGLLLVGTAYAHARYLRSEPGADAVIATSPSRVDIWFAGELFRRQGENTIRVIGPDGQAVHTGETELDDDDRTHIRASIQSDLPPGRYLVEWRNVSLEDGHPEEGSFNFTLDPQAAATSTPMGQTPASVSTQTTVPEAAPRTGGPCSSVYLPVGGAFVVGLIHRFRRKQPSP